MSSDLEPFVHILLFQCRKCGEPVVATAKSGDRNLEWLDGDSFELRCECGWTDRLLGILALKHWVAAWPRLPV
jgi:hypothetical protein